MYLPLQDAKQLLAVSIWVGNLALQVGGLLIDRLSSEVCLIIWAAAESAASKPQHHDACTVTPHSCCLVLADCGHHNRTVLHWKPISQCCPSRGGEHALPITVPARHRHGCWDLNLQLCKIATSDAPVHHYNLSCAAGRWLMPCLPLGLRQHAAPALCCQQPGRSSGGTAYAASSIEDVPVGQRRLCTPLPALGAGVKHLSDCSVSAPLPALDAGVKYLSDCSVSQEGDGLCMLCCKSSFCKTAQACVVAHAAPG